MKKLTRIEPAKAENKKLKVAAYCRVSTKFESQQSSIDLQVSNYKTVIQSNPRWEYAGVYFDYGSGLRQTGRSNLEEMINKACAGEIDYILTKSLSRLSRNVLNTLIIIRKLKERGINMYFENENLNSIEDEAEFAITLSGILAQEESRNLSENIQWGYQRKFENGDIFTKYKNFMGYQCENGNLVIIPEQAEVVKTIFNLYLGGMTLQQIKEQLESQQIKTATGKHVWATYDIQKMLKNEKLCGDARMQKTYTVDFLTKKRVKNDGYIRQYYVSDNHEAIIPKELFHQVQAEKVRRASLNKSAVTRKKNQELKEKSKYSSKYILSDLMVCGECGHAYRRQIWSKYGDKSAVWRCEDRLKQGKKSRCQNSPTLKEEQLHDAIMKAINNVVENTGEFIGTFRENVIRIIGSYSTQGITTEYDEQIEKLQQQMLILIENNAKQGAISEEFDEEYKKLSEQINELKSAKIKMVQAQKNAENYVQRVEELDKTIGNVNPQVRDFDQDLVKRLISAIRVHKGMKLEIQFHSGIVVKQDVDYYE